MFRRRPPLHALLGALLVSTLVACGDDRGAIRESDLRVLFNASLNGYIEPCGCVVGKTGGVDRIVERIDRHRAEHPHTIFLEGGDLFAEDPLLPANQRDQLGLKADAMFGLWQRAGCRAMGLGDLDLQLGVRERQRLAAEYEIPILCANLVDRSGQRPFPASHEFEIGGLRVGVFSLLAPKLLAAGPKDNRAFEVRRDVEALGYELTDWRETVEEVVADLRPRVDYLIGLTHLGVLRNRRLAKQHPEIDLIISPHEDNAEGALELVEGVPIAVSTIRGSRLGRVDLWLPQGLEPSDPRPAWKDVSDRIWPEVNLATVERGLRMVAGRELSLGSAEFRTRRDGMQAERLHNAALLLAREPIPAAGGVSYVAEPLPLSSKRSEQALAAIDDYHAAVHAHWTGDGLETVHPTEGFVGPKACYECHTQQYEFWKSTPHSHAFATLQATQQHVDAECIQCHTAGYELPGGFATPTQYPGFENVQCAACHGPGGAHIEGGASYARSNLVPTPAAVCAGCHNDEHHPRFESVYADSLARVACPPMGAGTPALAEARVEAADALAVGDEVSVDAAVALYARAGDPERALEVARQWLADRPASGQARLAVGELSLLFGDVETAASMAESVTRRRPTVVRGWKLRARTSLSSGDLEDAALAIAEGVSLDRNDPELAIVGARVAAAAGDLEAAIGTLRAFLQINPGASETVAPVLEELLEQRG